MNKIPKLWQTLKGRTGFASASYDGTCTATCSTATGAAGITILAGDSICWYLETKPCHQHDSIHNMTSQNNEPLDNFQPFSNSRGNGVLLVGFDRFHRLVKRSLFVHWPILYDNAHIHKSVDRQTGFHRIFTHRKVALSAFF
jgi:hypothetical protein